MSWMDGMRQRARMLFRRKALEQELSDELAFHLAQERERQQAAGLTPEAARRAALISLSGAERLKEEVRAEWTPRVLAGWTADLRDGYRQLVRRPALSALAVMTLALGMGANTAIFSLVRAVLLTPLPFAEPSRLAMIWDPGDPDGETNLSDREFLEYSRALQAFGTLGAYTDFEVNLTGDGDPERVIAAAVTASLFPTLGVTPVRGRPFTPEEDQPGLVNTVLLSERLWERRYGRADDLVGGTILLGGRLVTVVGIMPASFQLPMDFRSGRPTELWIPLPIDGTAMLPWGSRSNHIVGRLRPGVSLAQATADVRRVTSEWGRLGYLGDTWEQIDRAAIPLDRLVLGEVRPALLLLFGAVAVVLLIACANVTHLLLARADVRAREIATRAALGAGRGRLARQLLVESALLGVVGGAVGLVIAVLTLRATLRFVPVHVIQTRTVSLDAGMLGYAAALALLVTLLAGLAPVLHLTRPDLSRSMGSVRGETTPAHRRLRRVLVRLETGMALMLAIGATLLARSFVHLRAVDLGFRPDHVLTAHLTPSGERYRDSKQVEGFYEELLGRVRQLPGVAAAGAARIIPLAAQIGNWTITTDRPEDRGRTDIGADWQIVTPGYVEAAGLTVVAGRPLSQADDPEGALVVMVSETMARRYWGSPEGALGRRFHLGTMNQPWLTIIGVLADVRHNAVVEGGRVEMYVPHSQWARAQGGGSARASMSLVVRATPEWEPLALLTPIRRELRAIDPSLPLAEAQTMDVVAAAALARQRFSTTLLGGFAGLAVLLATIGLYAVMSYTAARRTHEMGVRMALGADRQAMIRMVVGEGIGLTVSGVVIGLVGAALATRLLAGTLYRVPPLDPLTFVGVPLLLLAAAGVAAYLPARRAARVSPVIALRGD